jgi:CTP:molybdopterin cytidylyltransferase MocA
MAPAGEIGAVVLSGGLSRRMGRHKALIPFSGSTFLETIISTYRDAGVDALLTVTHQAVAGDPDFPELEGVDLLVLPEATRSPLHTLWHALDRIEDRWSAFFLHPVDHPFVRAETVRRMADLFEEKQPTIIQPRCSDRGGHPVLLDLSLAREIRSAPPGQGLRAVVRADPGRVCRLEVNDEGILKGVNRPSDLQ